MEKITMSPAAKTKIVNIVLKTLTYILLILTSVVMFFPFYYSVISSVRPNIESISGLSLWPKTFIWDNYSNLFRDMDIPLYFMNTVFMTAVGLFTNLFFCSLAAYALAKFRFPGRRIIHGIFLASMMIPGIVLLVPQYLITYRLGLVDSFAGAILPGAVGIYGVFFMYQFYVGVPSDMAEAARIDGAGELRIFLQIYIRMVVPGLITLGIFTFNSYWNSFLWPNIVLIDTDKTVLAVALKNYNIYYTENMGPLMAGSIVIVIPVFLVFVFGQKYIVNNMSFSGLKA